MLASSLTLKAASLGASPCPRGALEPGTPPPPPWIYGNASESEASDAVQKSSWSPNYPTCAAGSSQSPINVVTTDALRDELVVLAPHLPSRDLQPSNSGHGYELAALGAVPPSVIDGRSFAFQQVHWHAPAENLVDGEQAAMEGHFVHESAAGELAVLAVRFALSSECNQELAPFWASFPQAEGEKGAPTAADLNATVAPLLAHGFYSWNGSLTTPPCTEGVRWYLLLRTAPVCQAQVDQLRRNLRQTRGVDFSNRAAQPLNGRVVRFTPGGATSNSSVQEGSIQ